MLEAALSAAGLMISELVLALELGADAAVSLAAGFLKFRDLLLGGLDSVLDGLDQFLNGFLALFEVTFHLGLPGFEVLLGKFQEGVAVGLQRAIRNIREGLRQLGVGKLKCRLTLSLQGFLILEVGFSPCDLVEQLIPIATRHKPHDQQPQQEANAEGR